MKEVVTFGEIMMRLSPPNNLRFSQTNTFEIVFGGGESNVAVSLANFGIPVSFVSQIPKNDIGDYAIMELKKRNVGTNNILRKGDRLGIYFLETGAVSRGSKVIYDRSNSSFSQVDLNTINWSDVFKNCDWFHWTGITPAISQNAFNVCLEALKVADQMGITISTDLNYRKKLWKYGKSPSSAMSELVKYCDIILGNEEDVSMYFDIKPKNTDVIKGDQIDPNQYVEVSKSLMKKFPKAKKIITTLRGSINASNNLWSGVLYDGEKAFFSKTHNITHIVDRVGGGDSFMAGLIYGLRVLKDDQDALEFAAAASSLKHTIKGDFNLVTIDEVNRILSGDTSGRVSR